jgi:four helix bundle protein
MKSAFRDLLAWQKAMDLVDEIYRTVLEFPRHEQFGLSSQMRRSAVRIPSDIAEGSGRWNLLDFRRLLRDARGSAYELETQIVVAQRQRYITTERADELAAQCVRATQLINGLIRYINKRLRLGQRPTVNGERTRRSSP